MSLVALASTLLGAGLAAAALGAWMVRAGARRAAAEPARLAALEEAIDALLPQTQCGQCHYAGCRPYAAAIARGEAGINQCPPGGEAGVAALAGLLGVPAPPLDRAHGETLPPRVARIVEDDCIGCTKCIDACPVDAIIGAPGRMHVVLDDLCTGCGLCVPPCPVDCIDMPALATPPAPR